VIAQGIADARKPGCLALALPQQSSIIQAAEAAKMRLEQKSA
jgi:hypothetical protein